MYMTRRLRFGRIVGWMPVAGPAGAAANTLLDSFPQSECVRVKTAMGVFEYRREPPKGAKMAETWTISSDADGNPSGTRDPSRWPG